MSSRNEHHANHSHPVRDDSYPRRPGDLSRSPWVPGLVEVEFKSSSDSGVLDQNVFNASERRKPSDRWPSELLRVLRENQLLAWKPSFPLTYPWSKEPEDKAIDFYVASGRDRFVTFRFAERADVSRIADELRKVPQLLRAKPVARVAPPSINEPLLGGADQVQTFADGFESQWYAHRCNLPEVLGQFTGKNVVVAAIDWGFDRFHKDYGAHIALRKNIYNNNQGIANGNGLHHGTAVLGLAGARLNGDGMVGFAPDSILWAIQAGESQIMRPAHWRDAIDFVRAEPSAYRKVIILEVQTGSRGNIEAVLSINKAIVDAIASGVVVCVPAGNGTGDAGLDDQGDEIPETGSILVGATCFDVKRDVVCSRGGERIVVYAPGDQDHDVTCSNQPVGYRNGFGGTSGAVAKVAGAVALMLEADNSLTPAEVREILKRSPMPAVDTSGTKAGVLLDCKAAIGEVLQRISQ